MSENFLNKTGLSYYHNRAKTVFANKDEFNTLKDRVDEIIEEGGEPNKIEVIKVNGTTQTITEKTVDITVPEKTSDLTNDGDGSSPFATEDYVEENGGKIDKIKVNGTEQTITNKEVDIAVPRDYAKINNGNLSGQAYDGSGNPAGSWSMTNSTNGYTVSWQPRGAIEPATKELVDKSYVDTNAGKIDVIKVNGTAQTITNKEVDIAVPVKVSDITNDSNFQTETQVDNKISTAISRVYKYKGSVATVNDLPASGNTIGDVYDVQSTGVNYAWDGTKWDPLGSYVDTSLFWTSQTGQANTLEAITTAEIDEIIA